jgi:hypothetical protein
MDFGINTCKLCRVQYNQTGKSQNSTTPSFLRGTRAPEKIVAILAGSLSFFCWFSRQSTFPISYSVRELTAHCSALNGMLEIDMGRAEVYKRHLHFMSCRFDIFYSLISFNIHVQETFKTLTENTQKNYSPLKSQIPLLLSKKKGAGKTCGKCGGSGRFF